MALEAYEGEIRHLIEEDHFTHRQCADYLKNGAANINWGASEANIALFCVNNNIHRYDARKMSTPEICDVLESSVENLGPSYGPKMMTGRC